MTAELATGTLPRKFIPILRLGTWTEAAPSWLVGAFYISFVSEAGNDNAYKELLDTLLVRREKAPPVGKTDPSGSLPPRSLGVFDVPATEGELGSADRSAWPYVWKQLMDQEPGNPELLYDAIRWLRTNPDENTWSFVWEELARNLVDDPEVKALGMRWLLENEGGPGWAFVWRRLSEMDPGSPEMRALGRRYLERLN